MKKLAMLILALALALTPVLTACNDGQTPADTGTEAPTEMRTETPTEATTETETETETEVETQPSLYEGDGVTAGETVSGTHELGFVKTEAPTVSSGSVNLVKAGKTFTYQSTFYGHDSAINRDFAQYGWNYTSVDVDDVYYKGQFFIAEMTGDYYGDMVVLDGGKLSIYPAVVTTNKTFEFNGQTHDSVYAYEKSDFAFGEPREYELGLSDATLRGVGDFDANGYADVLLARADGTILLGLSAETGITVAEAGRIHGDPSKLHAGDVEGDGYCDLVYIDKYSATPMHNTGNGFSLMETVTLPFNDEYTFVTVGDVNNDTRADVMWYTEEGTDRYFRAMFGRGDGFFGPRPEELTGKKGNTNLYAYTKRQRMVGMEWFALGDLSGDGIPDLLTKATEGSQGGLYLHISADSPAYDYSLFGMVTSDGQYKMFAGGRWFDQSDAVKDSMIGREQGEGDHVMIYSSKDGIKWDRYIDGPSFYLGIEQGIGGWEQVGEGWWTGNTLEPEVVYVDGVYHMILQSSGYTQSGWYGDYLGYASSTDGIHFTRKTDSPIILPEAGKDFTQFKEVCGYEIGFNHHELIYVADDPDGKVFHLYTGHFKNNQFAGYVRLRSADPTCFYWNEREVVDGFAQIGNQIGYISNYDGNGNRLFLRITFDDYTDKDGKRTVPVLQYSVDGLNFFSSKVRLASVDVTDPVTENNHNVYFLGFCTVNGTGELERNEDGSYKLVYLATTSATPVAPEIFGSEAGVGVLNFTLE